MDVHDMNHQGNTTNITTVEVNYTSVKVLRLQNPPSLGLWQKFRPRNLTVASFLERVNSFILHQHATAFVRPQGLCKPQVVVDGSCNKLLLVSAQCLSHDACFCSMLDDHMALRLAVHVATDFNARSGKIIGLPSNRFGRRAQSKKRKLQLLLKYPVSMSNNNLLPVQIIKWAVPEKVKNDTTAGRLQMNVLCNPPNSQHNTWSIPIP